MSSTTLSVKPRIRKDGRAYYANVTDPRTGTRRQLSWPGEVDANRFVAVLANEGWDAAMADYNRLKSTRGDRSEVAADRAARTVAEAAADYIASRKSESTRKTYRGRLRTLAGYPDIALARTDRLTVEDVTLFAKWLHAQPMAHSGVFNTWVFLSQVLNLEVRQGRLHRNVCQAVEKSDRPAPQTTAQARQAATLVDQDELEAILALAPDPVTGLLFRALYASGCRYGEMLALAPRHVKVKDDKARLVVERTWAADEVGGGWHLGPTKGKNTRTVYVPAALGEALLALGTNPDTGCLAFPSHTTAQGRWRAMRNEAGHRGLAPEGVRIHDLRHSRITHLLEAGANPVAVSRMAGHASVQFTMDRYGHVRDDAAMALADM